MPLGDALVLFWAALLSATLVPGGSETMLVYFLQQGYPKILLLLLSTVGNASGAVLNYFLGVWGGKWLTHRWLGFKKKTLVQARGFFDKWGGYAIFLSFLPVIGDPITAVAGMLRYSFAKFLFIMTAGKLLRYALVIQGFDLYDYFFHQSF